MMHTAAAARKHWIKQQPAKLQELRSARCRAVQNHQSIVALAGHSGLWLGAADGVQDFPGQSADRSHGGLDQSSCDSGVRTNASSAEEVQRAVHETSAVQLARHA